MHRFAVIGILFIILIVFILTGSGIYVAVSHGEVSILEALEWATFIATTQGDISNSEWEGRAQSNGLKWLSVCYAFFAASYYLVAIVIGMRAMQA